MYELEAFLSKMSEDFIETDIPLSVAQEYVKRYPLSKTPIVLEILNFKKCSAIINDKFYMTDQYGNIVGFNEKTLVHIDCYVSNSRFRLMPNNPSSDIINNVISNHEILIFREKSNDSKETYSIGFKNKAGEYVKKIITNEELKLELAGSGLKFNNKENKNLMFNPGKESIRQKIIALVDSYGGHTNKTISSTERFRKNISYIKKAAEKSGMDVID